MMLSTVIIHTVDDMIPFSYLHPHAQSSTTFRKSHAVEHISQHIQEPVNSNRSRRVALSIIWGNIVNHMGKLCQSHGVALPITWGSVVNLLVHKLPPFGDPTIIVGSVADSPNDAQHHPLPPAHATSCAYSSSLIWPLSHCCLGLRSPPDCISDGLYQERDQEVQSVPRPRWKLCLVHYHPLISHVLTQQGQGASSYKQAQGKG